MEFELVFAILKLFSYKMPKIASQLYYCFIHFLPQSFYLLFTVFGYQTIWICAKVLVSNKLLQFINQIIGKAVAVQAVFRGDNINLLIFFFFTVG